MTPERYMELDLKVDGKLTSEEIAEGWHFCPDYDFMLFIRGDNGCLCRTVKKESRSE